MTPSCGQIWKLTDEGWKINRLIDLPYIIIQEIRNNDSIFIEDLDGKDIAKHLSKKEFLKWYEFVEEGQIVKLALDGIKIHKNHFVFINPTCIMRITHE